MIVRHSFALCSLLSILLLCAAGPIVAQGSAQDYERADKLRTLAAGKVFRATVTPHWIEGTGRFWYRNDLPAGKREFVLVDAAVPSKRPAFDHARLAASLAKALGRPVSADGLPVEAISFAGPKTLKIRVAAQAYECDLDDYSLKPTTEAIGTARSLSRDRAPRPSRSGGAETSLTVLNKTAGEVSLYWIDTMGQRQPYGTLAPGEQRVLHTYAGHVWLVASKAGATLGVFVAGESAELAQVDSGPQLISHLRVERPAAPAASVRVRDFNVVMVDKESGQETVLTKDGTADDYYSGSGVFSPDGSKFVVFKTVPGEVHKIYEVESSPRDQLQPKLRTLDYPKPGDRVEVRKPHLFDVAAKREIPISNDLFPNPYELNDLRWEPDGKGFRFLYNQRGHQVLRVVRVDAATGAATAPIDETSRTFIDYSGKMFFRSLDATREAIWMSERDGWNHLYLYDMQTGKVKNQITSGKWVVRAVDRVDEGKRQIWFRAGGMVPGQDPYYVQYCRVNFDGTGLTRLTDGDGTHTVSYSPDGSTLVDSYSRADMAPVTELRRTSDGARLLELEKGDASALLATGFRLPERFTAKGRDGVTDIYGVICRPSNFDPKRKYPIVEQIYAGPQDSFVPKAFMQASGLQSMAELGFIVVQIDGMGTSNRSKAFHDVCWKNLGDAGFADRILWIKTAAAKYPYMDLSRIGIYGGSAGGQNALGGMLTHGDFYKVGVADCGCHDNRMDKIWWNEQWMGWPIGPHYAEQSNVTLAPRLQGKLLLLVGELDNNVDPASTMQVVNALVKANKDFELLVMPGAGHGVAGTPYGRRRERDFLVRNLLGVEPRH